MGRDVDGFVAQLAGVGCTVRTKGIITPPPRLDQLDQDVAAEVLDLYRRFGGRHQVPNLRPGSWDLEVGGILVEIDEELHFNRYRGETLACAGYERLSRFPLEEYRLYCEVHEGDCLRPGSSQGRWMNDSTEAHFGPSDPRGVLGPAGSSRWKQRALYDVMKDLTQLELAVKPLARIAIWDTVPGLGGLTVHSVVHQPPSQEVGVGLRVLIEQRAGVPLAS